MSEGTVTLKVVDRIATITFSHPKGNSLPGTLLKELTRAISGAGDHSDILAVILQSTGEGAFCAGASFHELLQLDSIEKGTEFFSGFASVILAMRACPCPVITRVQGKAVGGGVGIIAASDIAIAANTASVRLSELTLGFGPFVIEPVIKRRIGAAHTALLALSAEWHDAAWATQCGLFNQVCASTILLDETIATLSNRYRTFTRDAVCSVKKVLWEGTSDWTRLLHARAEEAARLAMSPGTRKNLEQFFASPRG